MTELTLHINHSSSEQPLNTSGVDWTEIDENNDYLIFSEGSAPGQGVSDGDSIPTEAELNRYATELSEDGDVVVSKYFLADYSANELKEIFNAGNQQKRYAFCASFDGATASEPQLEAWDNQDLDTHVDPSLGSGVPSASWYKGICTTTSTPGADWSGTPLAGSGASNIILLNDGNGALTIAKDLYFNFKVVIPAGYITPALHTPVLVITYTTN